MSSDTRKLVFAFPTRSDTNPAVVTEGKRCCPILDGRPRQSVYLFLARLYESTGRAIAVTTASALASALLKIKFLVKDFMTLYLLKLWMDQVDTLHVGRYWSEVLCCTIMTHLGDLEVKVTDLEILCLSFWLKFL